MSINKIQVMLKRSDEQLYNDIVKLAERNGVSITDVLRHAVKFYLTNNPDMRHDIMVSVYKKISEAREKAIQKHLGINEYMTRDLAETIENDRQTWTDYYDET